MKNFARNLICNFSKKKERKYLYIISKWCNCTETNIRIIALFNIHFDKYLSLKKIRLFVIDSNRYLFNMPSWSHGDLIIIVEHIQRSKSRISNLFNTASSWLYWRDIRVKIESVRVCEFSIWLNLSIQSISR